MQTPEARAVGRFYFALPRLISRLSGGSGVRCEQNWVEMNAVGGAIHLIAFLFAARLLLAGMMWWTQVLWAIPVAFLVWFAWMLLFYANWLLIRLLRICGLLRRLPNDRAQGLLIATEITACACAFVQSGSWLQPVGFGWIALLGLNLAAALALTLLGKRNG
ncbi:MAG: hypothetical protein ACR2ID_08485 [Chthoniobacterales bacterium]